MLQRTQQRLQQRDVASAMLQLLHSAGAAQKQRFRNNMTEIAFFKNEKGVYKAYRLTISMPGIDKGDARLHFETDSVVAVRRTEGFLVLGHYAAFDKYEKQVNWSKPVEAIRKLIRLQAAITPDDVSAASDIYHISD